MAESKKVAEVGGGVVRERICGLQKEEGLGNGQGQNEAQLLEWMCGCGLQSVWLQGDLRHTFRDGKGGRVCRRMVSWPLLHRPDQAKLFSSSSSFFCHLASRKTGPHKKRTILNPLSILGSTNDTSVPQVNTDLSALHYNHTTNPQAVLHVAPSAVTAYRNASLTVEASNVWIQMLSADVTQAKKPSCGIIRDGRQRDCNVCKFV